MTSNSVDQALASAANQIWKEVSTALKHLPHMQRCRAAKVFEELKVKASRDLVKTALPNVVTGSPDKYMTLSFNRCFTPSCFSRGNVCLPMLSH